MNTIAATNRKARYQYHIIETLEAGIELKGCEVKSIRESNVSLKDAFARVDNGQIFLYNCHITPYKFTRSEEIDPLRRRKLLLHKRQINHLWAKTSQKGMALIPLKLYFKKGIAKVELALGKGKVFIDKRERIKKRETDREIRRAFKGARK